MKLVVILMRQGTRTSPVYQIPAITTSIDDGILLPREIADDELVMICGQTDGLLDGQTYSEGDGASLSAFLAGVAQLTLASRSITLNSFPR
jgi:hypothetical protein